MKKVVTLTESQLVKIIENLTLGHELEEKKETSERSKKEEEILKSANPVAKDIFKKIEGHLNATKGAFSLQDKNVTENFEDDKLYKKWNWKTNNGKVNVTVTVDVKMND